MTENDSLRTINTFMFPAELQTVEECDRYIVLCERKRAFIVKMKPPRYTIVRQAWDNRIVGAHKRRDEIKKNG